MVVMKQMKRIAGALMILIKVLVLAPTIYPILFIFYGIDAANAFMDKSILHWIEWLE
jgi:hypothetical protein